MSRALQPIQVCFSVQKTTQKAPLFVRETRAFRARFSSPFVAAFCARFCAGHTPETRTESASKRVVICVFLRAKNALFDAQNSVEKDA
jgi:hypothetical protein